MFICVLSLHTDVGCVVVVSGSFGGFGFLAKCLLVFLSLDTWPRRAGWFNDVPFVELILIRRKGTRGRRAKHFMVYD